jgi:hypothetical protein
MQSSSDVSFAANCPVRSHVRSWPRSALSLRGTFPTIWRLGPVAVAGVIADGVGWSTGTKTFTLTGKDGNPQQLSGNWVDMLKREGTVWKVSSQATVTGCSQ